jgi:phosphoribosylformylglycinamidine cyclo-ligase
MLEVIDHHTVKGIAHITGGGFFENLPRILPETCEAHIQLGSWAVPPVFSLLQEAGHLEEEDLYGTFNMGIGLMVVAGADEAAGILSTLDRLGEQAWLIGEIKKGEKRVTLCSP